LLVTVLIAQYLASALTPASGSAKEQILCSHVGDSDIVITLGATRQFNRTLNCIQGNFVVDITPCAPAGAYGLSAPTGSAELVGVVDRWQDYARHNGGVTQHFVNDHEIYFSGGFTNAGSGYKKSWSFSVSRLTGAATLTEFDLGGSLSRCPS
jgi:hypothetical protein